MKKILVIDDDEGILDAIGVVLDSAGYEVQMSQNGEVIKQLQPRTFPDLILLDVLLSGEDGRDLCKLLKENSTTKDIPIIMFSADPNVQAGIKLCKADDFLAKPFDIDDLLNKITHHLH